MGFSGEYLNADDDRWLWIFMVREPRAADILCIEIGLVDITTSAWLVSMSLRWYEYYLDMNVLSLSWFGYILVLFDLDHITTAFVISYDINNTYSTHNDPT